MTASLVALGATVVTVLAVVRVPPIAPDHAARSPFPVSPFPPGGTPGPSKTPGVPARDGPSPSSAAPAPGTSDADPPRVRALPRRPVAPERPGQRAPAAARGLGGVAPWTAARWAAGSLRAQATRVEQRMAAHRRWGLPVPLPEPPPPPETKVRVPGAGPIFRVPTDDRVIFLTADDGWHKDPRFVELLRDLDVPLSVFLTDEAARGDYGYFERLRLLGNAVHNHTVTHPELPRLSYEEQRREICRQQRLLTQRFGRATSLFRPPFGAYDADTVRAARQCGVRTMVLWSLEAFADRVEFSEPRARLRPGDIVLTHFRGPDEWDGTMVDMARRVLRMAAEQGFAVARLEDYLAG